MKTTSKLVDLSDTNNKELWQKPIPFDVIGKVNHLENLIFDLERKPGGMGKVYVLIGAIKSQVKELVNDLHVIKVATTKDKDREYILCAAIYYKCDRPVLHNVTNLTDGLVLSGHRHCNIIAQYFALTGKPSDDTTMIEEGFLTSKNRFVSRQKALEIAKNNNQLIDGENTFNKLYSENLY